MKKQLAMLLTVAMGLTLLTGCGSDDGKSSSASVEESGSAAENTEQGSVQESEEPDDTGSTESTNGEKSLADYEKETRLNLFMGDPGITDEEFNSFRLGDLLGVGGAPSSSCSRRITNEYPSARQSSLP